MKNGASKAANALVSEHRHAAKFHPFAAAHGIARVDDAYAVQDDFVRMLMRERAAGRAGYKIGLTSKRMQEMCGIDSPIAGVILDDSIHASGARLQASSYGRLGVEFEIAVRLARDLPGGVRGLSPDDVAAAVDAVCPAIELIDDRDADYAGLDVLSLIADNSWNAGVVLGDFSRVWPDLAAVEGVVAIDGAAADRGLGRDVLGHPFQSVAWLAAHLAARGETLRAGDIVMTGSIVTTKFPERPTDYRFEVAGLGAVGLSVI